MGETWSVHELLAAGWGETDLAWEAASERAVEAVAKSDRIRAREEASRALQLARDAFESTDPRLGTGLANYGICLYLSGDTAGAAPLFQKSLEVWRNAAPWIAGMQAPRVARSSLFHMRMEVRHRDAYRARWQERWQEINSEAVARLEALNVSRDDLGGAGAEAPEALARWRRERPAMLNDTRKLMAAAFLLLAPGVPGPSAAGGRE